MTILFIGNSHTYYHGMPYQCREMLKLLGLEAQVAMVAQPGQTLAWHSENPASRLALQYGEWDHVVLQQATHPFCGGSELLDGVRGVMELLPKGPAVWFYKTWCPKASPGDQAEIDDEFSRVSSRFGMPVVPVADAWHEVERRAPGHELYDADGKHAGPGGSYVTALCMARVFSGRSVAGLPATLRHRGRLLNQIPPTSARLYQAVVDDLIAHQNVPAWH